MRRGHRRGEPIRERLFDVVSQYLLAPLEVRDRPRQTQHAIVTPAGQLSGTGDPEQALDGRASKNHQRPRHTTIHVAVAECARSRQPLTLTLARLDYPRADRRGSFTATRARLDQLSRGWRRDLTDEVDPIE